MFLRDHETEDIVIGNRPQYPIHGPNVGKKYRPYGFDLEENSSYKITFLGMANLTIQN